jgi:hypothetical protein|eukprot:COSAG01_NODE_8567_length_2737_cov_9.320697_4_plen_60_part_00
MVSLIAHQALDLRQAARISPIALRRAHVEQVGEKLWIIMMRNFVAVTRARLLRETAVFS